MKKLYANPQAVLVALSETDLIRTSEVNPEDPTLKVHDLGGRDLLGT